MFSDGSRGEVRRGAPPPPGLVARALDGSQPVLAESGRRRRATPACQRSRATDSRLRESGGTRGSAGGQRRNAGVFRRARARLVPVAAATSSVLGAFATLEAAVAARDARARGRGRVRAARSHLPRRRAPRRRARFPPADAESALLAEVEASDAAEAAAAVVARSSRVSRGRRDGGHARAGSPRQRRSSGSCVTRRARSSPARSRAHSMQFVEDGCVPRAARPRTCAACARFSRRTGPAA